MYRDFLAAADGPPQGRPQQQAAIGLDLLCERFGSTPVAAFTVADLEAWMRWLAALPDPKDPARTRYNITSVKHHVATVRQAWQWAVRHKPVTADRRHEMKAAKYPRPGDH